jgi:5-methylthioadenosine/S-adenosylhomocysteine deaminase
MSSLLVRNASILTMNEAFDRLEGDVHVEGGWIRAVGPAAAGTTADLVIDARGGYLLPGFVQTHVHLCQTLFRGFADDLPLLDWLRRRVWPLEAAHDAASLGAATRLAAAELLSTGTTAVLTMETVHDTDAVLDALVGTGLRATVGKCLMDAPAEGVPDRLREPARAALDESLALRARWDGTANGRLRVALAPRFAVSCTRELLEAVAAESAASGTLVHTHASESREEIALVRHQSGLGNIAYLGATGLASARLCAAHCIWVDEAEQRLLAERQVKVLHCPGSNLKLGSGLAPVPELRAHGVSVSLGADGAACNNRLDMFDEMRLAATLQALRLGPGSLRARDVVAMATREGARALGLEREIGCVAAGYRADLIVVDRDRPHLVTAPDPYSALVYAARGTDVRTVVVDGEVLVDDFTLVRADPREVAAEAAQHAARLARRAGLD